MVKEYAVALYPFDVVVGVSSAESADLTPKGTVISIQNNLFVGFRSHIGNLPGEIWLGEDAKALRRVSLG